MSLFSFQLRHLLVISFDLRKKCHHRIRGEQGLRGENSHLLRTQFLLRHQAAAHQHPWNLHQLMSARYWQMRYQHHHLLVLEETAEETKSKPIERPADGVSNPNLQNTISSRTFPKIPIAKSVGAIKQPEPLVAQPSSTEVMLFQNQKRSETHSLQITKFSTKTINLESQIKMQFASKTAGLTSDMAIHHQQSPLGTR